MKTYDINIIDGLLSYFLPVGIFDYFKVTGFAEAPSTESDVLYDSALHIYLDERDNRTPDIKNSKSDGFGEESCLSDFPAHEKNDTPSSSSTLDNVRRNHQLLQVR